MKSTKKLGQIYEVKKYDDETWKNTVNFTSTPSDWFGGDADKIGAKSKITLLNKKYNTSISNYFNGDISSRKNLS